MKPWYQSLTMKALIVSALIHVLTMLGVAEEVASKSVADFIESALPFVGLLLDAIASFGRARAKGPLAATKDSATKHLLMLALVAPTLLVVLSGCTHTREAYKVAEGVEEQGYVAVEHYASLIHEATELKAKATTPLEAITAMQAASAKAQPVIRRVRDLRDAYMSVNSAENQEQLQEAVNEAILLLADLVRAVNKAKGEPVGSNLYAPPLLEGSFYQARLVEVLR